MPSNKVNNTKSAQSIFLRTSYFELRDLRIIIMYDKIRDSLMDSEIHEWEYSYRKYKRQVF